MTAVVVVVVLEVAVVPAAVVVVLDVAVVPGELMHLDCPLHKPPLEPRESHLSPRRWMINLLPWECYKDMRQCRVNLP